MEVVVSEASIPTFSITVNDINNSPEIVGDATVAASSDTQYSFTPTATDADNDQLTFSIENKPSWATFSTANGELTGTPAESDAGIYKDIIISVTDAVGAVTSLDAFRINVTNDIDGDGIPNSVEEAMGLNKNNATDALLDPDADKLTNYEEYILGTDISLRDTDSDGILDEKVIIKPILRIQILMAMDS